MLCTEMDMWHHSSRRVSTLWFCKDHEFPIIPHTP
jgi:hypothetical protein